MKIKIVLFTILFAAQLSAQTKITDSIRNVIFSVNDKGQKLSAILDYLDQYQSLNIDTVYNYALIAMEMAAKTKDSRNIARAELAFANSYAVWGWVDSTQAVCDMALKKYDATNAATRDVYFKLLRQKGLSYGGVQKYPEALTILYKLLDEAKQYKDSIAIATTCNSIGSIYINMNKTEQALKWINDALVYDTKNENFIAAKAAVYVNLANVYMLKKDNTRAMQFISKAVPICRQAQNLNTLATALRISSMIQVNLKKNDEGEKDLREMISIRNVLSGGSNLSEDNLQIAHFYANTGQLKKAIESCKQYLKSGNVQNSADTIAYSNHLNVKLDYYQALAEFYKQAGMASEYTNTLEAIINAKESFYEDNSAQAIAEMQTKYETEQKEKTILQQKYDLTKKNFLLYGTGLLSMLIAIIFYQLFKAYQRRQKLKMDLALEEEQVERKSAVKRAEENERKRIAADLHDNLGVQANAILYNSELLKNELTEHDNIVEDLHDTAKLMLLNLRETLWAMKTNDIEAVELWLRIISFSKQMGRHYTDIKFAITGTAPNHLLLPSAKALNIIMIVQEAVHNAVKHSGAEKIDINTQFENNDWILSVSDNGNGFDVDTAFLKKDSYGLKNMMERAANYGLVIAIRGNDTGGSMLIIRISGNKNI